LQLKEALESKVVVLWSGGLDTTGLIFLLLENYDCEIFPLFVNRGQRNYEFEKASIDYFSNVFEGYDKFRPAFQVTIKIPPNEFNSFKFKAKYAIRNSDIINQGVRYALEKNIHAVLVGTFKNEDLYGDGSEEYLIAKTTEVEKGIVDEDGNYNFLICSPFHKPPFPQTKSDLIKLYNEKLDLSKTHSCYSEFQKHCGTNECTACQNRINAFKDAGIEDKTEYMISPT